MKYEIRPGEGIGPIRFGMSRKQVAEVMSKEKGALPLSKRGEIDCFFQACFQISYTPREEVDFIEVASGGPQLIFQGADLFKLSAADLVRHVEKVDKADLDLCKPPSDYLFLKLILTLSEPRFDNEPHSGIPDRYEAIGLGNEKYLAAIRRILGEDLFKKRWSDNTKPKASGKKAVNKLLAMGAKLALDDQGDVRRVQFLSHWLTKPLADSDLVDLTGFNNLEALWLAGNRELTDVGLPHLISLHSLKALDFRNTGFTDALLDHLDEWPQLIQLGIPEQISANGWAQLHLLQYLKNLALDYGQHTEKGLVHLAALTNLRDLSIKGAFTDKGLVHLNKLENLEKLTFLADAKVTDKGILILKALKNLQQLSLGGAKVTDKGVAKLREHLPDLEVYR